MKISIIDTVFPAGHKDFNGKLVSLLPVENNDILVFNFNDFYLERESFKYKNIQILGERKRYVFTIMAQIFNYFLVFMKTYKRHDDVRLFFTFDNYAFYFGRFLFLKSKNIIFHHNNIDLLNQKHSIKFFKRYMNSVKHVVFAEFIKKRLIDIGVKEDNIYISSRPIPLGDKESFNTNILNRNVLSIGYASDEEIIDKIIEYKEGKEVLSKNGINILVRSKFDRLNQENILFINGHLSKEKYEEIYLSSYAVLILYPNNFQYRYSGVIEDALRYKKFIIGTNIPIVNYFKALYPDSCYIFNSIEELFSIMAELVNKKFNIDEYNAFIKNHSNKKVKNDLKFIIEM